MAEPEQDTSAPGPTTAARSKDVSPPLPPPFAWWRSETQTPPCQKEEKEPAELRRVEWPPNPVRDSLGEGQVQGGRGWRRWEDCVTRGGLVTEVARGGKLVLRMRKEALYQHSQEQRGKLFASGQIPQL